MAEIWMLTTSFVSATEDKDKKTIFVLSSLNCWRNSCFVVSAVIVFGVEAEHDFSAAGDQSAAPHHSRVERGRGGPGVLLAARVTLGVCRLRLYTTGYTASYIAACITSYTVSCISACIAGCTSGASTDLFGKSSLHCIRRFRFSGGIKRKIHGRNGSIIFFVSWGKPSVMLKHIITDSPYCLQVGSV